MATTLGKGKKRSCIKGKSCGASCISKTKVCRIDLKGQFWKDLDKLIKEVQGSKPNKPKAPKAPNPQPEPKAPKPKPKPKVEVKFGEVGGERVNLTGKLSPLTDDHLTKLFKPAVSAEDYKNKEIFPYGFSSSSSKFQYAQNGLQKGVHSRANAIFRDSATREALLKKLGWSVERLNETRSLIRDFTGIAYGSLRASQKSTPVNQEFGSQKLRDLDAFLKAAPKENVVKYRSYTSDDARLKERIAAAKKGAMYEERAVTSWSTDPVASAAFMRGTSSQRPHRIMLRTVNENGVSVRSVSQHQGEDEILTNRGKYQYVGYREVKIGNAIVHVFDVREVPLK